jgi:hypothetical protein
MLMTFMFKGFRNRTTLNAKMLLEDYLTLKIVTYVGEATVMTRTNTTKKTLGRFPWGEGE